MTIEKKMLTSSKNHSSSFRKIPSKEQPDLTTVEGPRWLPFSNIYIRQIKRTTPSNKYGCLYECHKIAEIRDRLSQVIVLPVHALVSSCDGYKIEM